VTNTKSRPLDFDARFERARPMDDAAERFAELVRAVLTRFAAQNGHSLDQAEAFRVGRELFRSIRQRELPRPLSPGEVGSPGGMPESDCASIVQAAVQGSADAAWLGDAVKQLVKACFYPEFRQCRESYHEVGSDGVCRRQDLARAVRRVSGTHCVDCPHWTAMPAEAHRAFLADHWQADRDEFIAHGSVYLPEDFRALRLWVHAEALRQHGMA